MQAQGTGVVVDLGTRLAVVAADEPSAAYLAAAPTRVELEAIGDSAVASRAVIELRRFHGGMAPHVLVGGSYSPGGTEVSIVVGAAAQAPSARSCTSLVGGPSLFPGLAQEYVAPIIAGLSRGLSVGPGEITIDRFGFDPVETSLRIVEAAAELLGRTLSRGHQPDTAELTAWLERLP